MVRRRSKLVVDTADRERRVQQRHTVGRLRDNLIEKRTLERYVKAATFFSWWLMQMTLPPASDYEQLDLQLCNFLEYVWQCGESKGLAGDTLSGVQHFLMVRRKFSGAWRLLTAWGKLEVPGRAPPMLPAVALGLAGLALLDGRLDYSAILLFGFHAMLRIGEAFAITRERVAFNCSFIGVVDLGMTKGAKRKGAREFVECTESFVGKILVGALRDLQPGETLLRGSVAAFRQWFSHALVRAEVENHNLKPYSLRRGGATLCFQQSRSMSYVIERGRWSDAKTARIYVTEGLALLAQMKLSSAVTAKLESYATLLLV